MKTMSFNQMKRQEARNRAMVRRARRSPTAAAFQQSVSLVGDGAKWSITAPVAFNLSRLGPLGGGSMD
jgi:hypothetical protein